MITAARASQAICQYAAEKLLEQVKSSICYELIIIETVLLSLSESIRKLTEIWNKYRNPVTPLSDCQGYSQPAKAYSKS